MEAEGLHALRQTAGQHNGDDGDAQIADLPPGRGEEKRGHNEQQSDEEQRKSCDRTGTDGIHTAHPGFLHGAAVPERIVSQRPDVGHQHQQPAGKGEQIGGVGEQIHRVGVDAPEQHAQLEQAQNEHEDRAGQEVAAHGAVKSFHLDGGIGFNGDGIGAGGIEYLHLGPLEGKFPACLGAVVPKDLLAAGGSGVKFRGIGEIRHRKAQGLGLDAAVADSQNPDFFCQPSLRRHGFQVGRKTGEIIKGIEHQFVLCMFHSADPPSWMQAS